MLTRSLVLNAVVLLASLLGPSSLAAAAPVCGTFDPPAAFRGDAVRFVFAADSDVARGMVTPAPVEVTLKGAGKEWTAPLTFSGAQARFVIPADMPIGDYQVAFTGSSCTAAFPVRSSSRLTMTGLTPAGATSDSERIKDVEFTIQGTGFVTTSPNGDTPWNENQLWLNDMLQTNVQWNPPGTAACDNPNLVAAVPAAPPGSNSVPSPGAPPAESNATAVKSVPVQADVLDGQTIRVCHLDLSAVGGQAQGLFVNMGIKAVTARVAVGQSGVQRTAPWPFRLYPWWAGGTTVTLAAGAVTLLLAFAVYYCVLVYKRSKKDTPEFSAWYALFLDSETDTFSLSKLQFYLWTAASLFGYSYLVLSRLFVQGAEWPQVPENLPGVVGIGIATAVGAQVATNIRGPKGSGTERPGLGDFVMSGGVVAPDRVQMLVWTLLGVGIFVTAVAQQGPTEIKALYTVPSTLLVLSGISSAGYLGGKLARKPGPVIDELHIDPPDSDTALANAAVPPPGTVDLTSALTAAQNVVLPGQKTDGAKASIGALAQACAIVQGVKTVAQAADAGPALEAQRRIAENGATTAAAALAAVETPENALAAETAQRAAAAIGDLELAVRVSAGTFANQPAGTPRFERTITLRGRNLSPNGIFSIDNRALPFRMLRPDPLDPAAKRAPEALIPEVDNPELAMSLRLTIDPGQLAAADRQVYDAWFKSGKATPLVLKITNLDGQQDDVSFTVPPAVAQAPGKGADQGGK